MADGPLHPSSIYFGDASGNASPTFYIPNTNTNNAGEIEGIGIVASLGSDAPITLQFNLPANIPAGQAKLRLLAMANATSGNARITVADGVTVAGSSIGTTTMTTDVTGQAVAWSTADVLVETKIILATSMTANGILTILLTFATASWTLAAASVWQPTVVWE